MNSIIDSTPDAAEQLYRAIDRKVTIVNFDLHRLQDDLGESISLTYFGTCMMKMAPELHRLARLPHGASFAHEQIIKLVGNLTNHLSSGMGENKTSEQMEEDRHAQEDFFHRIDEVLLDVTKQREPGWNVGREVKRMEKNAEYLKDMGIGPYFPRTIQLMRQMAPGEY